LRNTKVKYFLIIILLFLPVLLNSQTKKSRSLTQNPTQLRKYVVDETNTLSSSEKNSLMHKLVDFEKETSNQFVVYMIPSLEGESIEEVSVRIAEENKIGKKDRDNGILLLIAKNDRKLRIEVGYGLEGALTDALASQIIRNEIVPSFKAGKYAEGINNGVDAIISATKGEYEAEEDSPGGFSSGCCFGLPIFIIVIFGVIFLMIFIGIIQRIFGIGRGTYSGSKSSGSGWSNWGSGSGWSSGSSSGSSFGGFSGGGGSFGGGGASGSW
jgi:uncharacterized protein